MKVNRCTEGKKLQTSQYSPDGQTGALRDPVALVLRASWAQAAGHDGGPRALSQNGPKRKETRNRLEEGHRRSVQRARK